MVKYLVVDEQYVPSFAFPEALIGVSRLLRQLQRLGYLAEPAEKLCDLYAYFNVAFLLEDFEEPVYAISRPCYPFTSQHSAKMWRRYGESLQALRYQDEEQRQDELRRFCATVIKFATDTFPHVISAEQNSFQNGYSLTINEADVNVWLRMAEMLFPVLAALAVIVNSTFHSSSEDASMSGDEAEGGTAGAVGSTETAPPAPPPAGCGLGGNMAVCLNHASDHVFSAICLANGKAGRAEAAEGLDKFLDKSIGRTCGGGGGGEHADADAARGDEPPPTGFGPYGDQVKAQGQLQYPLSFLHSAGFFVTLNRAAFMTSRVNRSTCSPYFRRLSDWLLTYFPNKGKHPERWESDVSCAAMQQKQRLLRDTQLLRAFSSYFYYTGLGEDLLDLGEGEAAFSRELAALAAYSDACPGAGGEAAASAPKVRGGIHIHELPLLDLIGRVVPPALPLLLVLRLLLLVCARHRRTPPLAVSAADAAEAAQEGRRMASFKHANTLTNAETNSASGSTELEGVVLEKPLLAAQEATYRQLEGFAKELLHLLAGSADEYEAQLSAAEDRARPQLERLGSVLEEEEALGIQREPGAEVAVNLDSISTINEPFVRRGRQLVLDLPYLPLRRLQGAARELRDLARRLSRGSRRPSHMAALRLQALLAELGAAAAGLRGQRQAAEGWLRREKQQAELLDLMDSNRRSILGV
jgi:hypothetical protein